MTVNDVDAPYQLNDMDLNDLAVLLNVPKSPLKDDLYDFFKLLTEDKTSGFVYVFLLYADGSSDRSAFFTVFLDKPGFFAIAFVPILGFIEITPKPPAIKQEDFNI